jgi:hypothetical protein
MRPAPAPGAGSGLARRAARTNARQHQPAPRNQESESSMPTMKSVVAATPGTIEVTETGRPVPGPRDVLLKVRVAAIKDAGYLHVPEGRRDHTTPPKPSASTASIRTNADIHGTRRSPARDCAWFQPR